LALTWLAVPAVAQAAGAESFVKTKQTQLMTLLKSGKSTAVDHKVEAICDQILDYDAMARESLGEFWKDRSPAERKEFESLLKQLVQRAYRKNLSKTLNYELSYTGEEQVKDGMLVKTVAKDKTDTRQEPINIDFNVRTLDAQPKIQDIVTDGSSLTNNYKNQFRRIIKKSGFPELLRRMKARLESGES
jgi:phospholipid transport system substrate-binding protein